MEGTLAMLVNVGPLVDELARLSLETGLPLMGSSANLTGTKARALATLRAPKTEHPGGGAGGPFRGATLNSVIIAHRHEPGFGGPGAKLVMAPDDRSFDFATSRTATQPQMCSGCSCEGSLCVMLWTVLVRPRPLQAEGGPCNHTKRTHC